ncbi:DUF2971 domain-containing protein [Enterobacter asburiae]|uniref:DUF2971 domain-containing protein n=1 Tax=Enterobacter asburiae TaxID=61645 RepID=UPI00293FFABF|nr:DUF2971 domain-containing protein [Enterobacter asburiae]HED1213781.1 DUF2971 domain-containing protein [Enterobacter asburiae]
MYFYKYLRVDNLNLSMLRHGEVFFASPKELNDIHECKPQFIFNADREVWTRFIDEIILSIRIQLNAKPKSHIEMALTSFKKDIYTVLLNKKKSLSLNYEETLNIISSEICNKAFDELDFVDARNVKKALNSYMQNELDTELNDKLYITSFSKSASILTMWGHYGNAEKGFAIVYETNDGDISLESDIEIFPSATKLSASSYSLGMSRFSKAKLLEVAYKNKPVRANAFRKLIPTFSFSDQEDFYDYRETLLAGLQKYNENDIGRVKYTDWKYEKELRLHLPVYDELAPPLRNIKISKQHIKGIIFGTNTSDNDKESILSACYHLKKSHSPESDLYVFQAKSIPSQYKIKITSLGRICDIYGRGLPLIEKVNPKKPEHSKYHEEILKMTEAINAS